MTKLLSVIIPVYNVESYLEKCVDSVLNQTYRNLEIILVNDGSTDQSGAICRAYAERDSRIILVEKENGGLSDARNAGMRRVSGEYVAFLDSDDSLKLEAYETMLAEMEAKELDILCAYPISVHEDGREEHDANKRSFHNTVLTGEDYLTACIRTSRMLWPVQFNIYRAELVKNMLFGTGILHEDMLWTPQVFLKAERVEVIDYEFYYYLKRTGSITHHRDKTKNALDLMDTCNKLEPVYRAVQNAENRTILLDGLAQLYLNAIYLGGFSAKDCKKYVKKRFLRNKACTAKGKLKVMLYCVSPWLYLKVNDLSKVFFPQDNS